MHKIYGYAKKGSQCFSYESALKGIKNSFLAAWCNGKIHYPCLIEGNFNKQSFLFWFENFMKYICKNFNPLESMIVLDNASIHNKEIIFQYAKKYQIYVLFLPPYSPDLNPIEKIWGSMKSYIRNTIAHFPQKSILDALSDFTLNYSHAI